MSMWLHEHMVAGILASNITADGGDDCYNQIPKGYHIGTAIASVLMHVGILWVWGGRLKDGKVGGGGGGKGEGKKRSWLEIFVAINCFVSLAFTFYFKWITGKGLFILNPCHISLLFLAILLLTPTTPLTQTLSSFWSSFLFGPLMALVLPHLYGISQFQIYLYYYEHLLILPIGPMILYRRYGYVGPGFKNQMAAFSAVVIYQFCVLLGFSLWTKVNLNFVLCHSPEDPFYGYIGYYYMTFFVFFLNFSSWVTRWLCYPLIWPLMIFDKFKKQAALQSKKE